MLESLGIAHLLAGELEMRTPVFLLLALLAPVVYFLANALPGALTYSSLKAADAAPRSLRVRLAFLPAALLAVATVCLAVAMAGPRTGDATTKVKREGIAIMLVVDRSGSMDARDFVEGDYSQSRLDAVKRALRAFVLGEGTDTGGRPNDLIGAVAFGTFADGICPLTLDHGNLMNIIDDLEVAQERSEAATAIGEGLALAVERLRSHPARSKVVVLLTDGDNNAGEIEPLQAAELAASLGIKVYTIGAGKDGVAPMPVNVGGQVVLRPMRVSIDEATLKDISERTDGRYFNAQDADGLVKTYQSIDRLERTEVTEVRYLQYREHYPLFVGLALVLVALSAVGGSTVLRRLP